MKMQFKNLNNYLDAVHNSNKVMQKYSSSEQNNFEYFS